MTDDQRILVRPGPEPDGNIRFAFRDVAIAVGDVDLDNDIGVAFGKGGKCRDDCAVRR